MKTQSRVLVAFAVGSVVGIAAGCQTYDFEPVEPLALAKDTREERVVTRNKKPNIMLLVDRSGSMHEPIVAGGVCSGCSATTPQNCAAGCVTRWRALESAMGTFLTGSAGSLARFGLAMFPNATASDSCVSGGVVPGLGIATSDDVDDQLAAHSSAINQYIASLPETEVRGGTPTAVSLGIASNTAELNTLEREDFVLLLTDGLPNCNAQISDAACTVCVTGASPPCQPDKRNCLDDQGAVNIINNLKSRFIRVIVVGFGADTGAGIAFGPLNRLAEAGGMARTCLDADGNRNPNLCGAGDTCDNTPEAWCSTRFYKAADAAQLTQALQDITVIVTKENPCEFKLTSTPSDVNLLQVKIDGAIVPQGSDTWIYDPPTASASPTVTFSNPGTICPRLLRATESEPVLVNISIIQRL